MSSRSKEQVASAIWKIFKGSSEKAKTGETNNNNYAGPSASSPSRRLRRGVLPAPTPNNKQATESTVRARRLMKEYKEIKNIQHKSRRPIFTVDLVNDNLYEWNARLHVVDPDSPLAHDMARLNIPHILLNLTFPDNFPFAPPFMRVVQPRIEKGYVMTGGAICMELLTPRGWASAYTVEALLMQFAASVVKGDGRISKCTAREYNKIAAEQSFKSLVRQHDKYGWVTPDKSEG